MTLKELKRVKVGDLIGAFVDRQWVTAKVTALSDGKISFYDTTDDHRFELTCEVDGVYFRNSLTL